MPELISSIVIGITSKVIGQLIVDMTKSKKKETTNEYIEKEVAFQVMRHSNQIRAYDIDEVVKRVMDEIIIISERDPDLKITKNKIKLAQNKNLINQLLRKKPTQDDIEARLKRLNEIINQRKNELEFADSGTEASGPLMIRGDMKSERIEQQKRVAYSEKLLKDTDDQIRNFYSKKD